MSVLADEVRASEALKAIRDRLNADSALTQSLRTDLTANAARNRVYLNDQDYTAPEGVETRPWGRVVIVPVTPAGGGGQTPRGEPREIAFLIRAEVNNFPNASYSVAQHLEAIQIEVVRSLRNFEPAGLSHVQMYFRLWLSIAHEPTAYFDDTRLVWFNSSEWRFQAKNKGTT